ncbi:MAG TPA: aminotransferase class V-fold PLP-dependent enzyme [Bacteroidia bacterium]|nr:aminotransferase class V-fold PLP-dependent enzyme [Bacteroidia bacterium]HNT80282.1 aminotransferase class V-fold PLP-dependent enzyme [Bacteroidia bacterium]
MISRREFIKNTTAAGLVFTLHGVQNPSFAQDLRRVENLDAESLAKDEDFWMWVRDSFTASKTIINLNNGGVSPQPRQVQEAHIHYYKMCNEAPSYYMWRILDQGREPLRERLAHLAGCDKEEIAINRNSTEALNTIIFGLDFRRGDEVILSKYDYPNMINAWNQRAKRDGIVLRFVELNLPNDNTSELVQAYTSLINSKTKVIHLTHVINWTGQIIPVQEIGFIAKQKGIEVIVDGAHSFAQLSFKVSDLNCDYFGTSLHKWLCAPFGSGLLYIRKEKISKIWALLSSNQPDGTDIRKFETIGTRNFASEMSIAHAIDFHDSIGSERKLARLRYLKNYWHSQVRNFENLISNTTFDLNKSCALAHISIKGKTASEFELFLFSKFKIHCSPIGWETLDGVRITPHLYTSLKDLDRLVEAIHAYCKK